MSAPWMRLSVRSGTRDDDGPFGGVPAHMKAHVLGWLMKELSVPDETVVTRPGHPTKLRSNVDLLASLSMRLRLNLVAGPPKMDALGRLILQCGASDDLCLDMVDAVLALAPSPDVAELQHILDQSTSEWTVGVDGRDLVLRVSDEAAEQFAHAVAPGDAAAIQLKEAWSNAYGRAADASDAWDHAIKAVEALLNPMVLPNTHKPTLGGVLQRLSDKPSLFHFVLEGPSNHDSQPVASLLRLMWPNPDRHEGRAPRTPTVHEARAVVQLAVLLVQWIRADAFRES